MARQNALMKATRQIEVEGQKQCFRIYGAMGIVLWRYWDKRREAITNFFSVTHDVWNACAQDHDHSMIEMCDIQTGIEIQNGSGVSWHDVAYLNGQDLGDMTYEQWLYMRKQQLKWIRPQIMACMMVSLHQKYGFGFDRCSRIYGQIEEVEREFSCKPDRIRKACFELTGIDVAMTTTTERRTDGQTT